ncbi:protein TBATA-like isoform X1 [Biomphalaria glabrata]|uniref:Protein TBATA-like isoform X1 n=1 Tax=Biomphalaria glabrata TaxID=6526 RepID=A0A9W2ZJ34_BIOGL|nr:protein TBATA-like isoform X1 [Biomphalaria glabrata]XP_055874954.1 protein TBATA-like isoform X1 [Biomphalaria glabrata]
MALSEVFRPSDGDLLVRDHLAHGPPVSVDTYKKDDLRPQTQGGYRFGQMSHNSFFTRHNPHPSRVRHFKGLLDVPICTVNDDGYFANPRYSLQFPPSNYDNTKLKQTWRGRIPVNAININSQLLPINTITGMQYFTGLNSYPFREKAIPRVGLVPVTEAWRDELAAFTKSLLQDNEALQKELSADQRAEEDKRPRSTMYSPETGRLIPPPSRAMSRGASRRGRGNQQFVTGSLQHISADPDLENIVMVMLCQILQTDDLNAVQAWLCSAGPREKELVMGLVKTAIAGKDEYYKQYPAEYITDNGREKLPPINGKSSGEVNRLVLDDTKPELKSEVWQKVQNVEQKQEVNVDTITNQTQETQAASSEIQEASQPVKPASPVLRRSKTTLQPAMLQPRQEKSFSAKEKTDSTKKQNQAPKLQLKYSKAQPTDKKEPMWSQNQSLNTF